MGEALCIDLVTFCEEMCEGALRWLVTVEGTEPFVSNYKRFARRHETGLSTYIVGVPVIG